MSSDDESSDTSSYDSEPDYVAKDYELNESNFKAYDNKGWLIYGWEWDAYADYKSPTKKCQYCKGSIRYVHKITHPKNDLHSEAFVGCKCASKLCQKAIMCPCDGNPVFNDTIVDLDHGSRDFSDFNSFVVSNKFISDQNTQIID